ncbi:hypothetical protein [Salinirubrum litoreum]|uniref:Uncharacterized protein n=1 Tax=Salinirubrum litoreum TaxID=1126234 RepID=A0ABD5R678_9EURY|nr:hypothetical protein [Salinirubrum litoreum]
MTDGFTAHLLADARLRLLGVVFAGVVLVVGGVLQFVLPTSQWLPASLAIGLLVTVGVGRRWVGG